MAEAYLRSCAPPVYAKKLHLRHMGRARMVDGSDGLLIGLAACVLGIAQAVQFLASLTHIPPQTVRPLERVPERTCYDVFLKYVIDVLCVFFVKAKNGGPAGWPIRDDFVPQNTGTLDVALEKQPVDRLWSHRHGIVKDGKIREISVSAADHQTVRQGTSDLIMGDYNPAILPAIDVEAVGGLDGLIVVKLHICHTPPTITNMIADHRVVPNLSPAAGDYDRSTKTPGPMVHGDVFDEISLILGIRGL